MALLDEAMDVLHDIDNLQKVRATSEQEKRSEIGS
jgi:hypothetical protein